MEPKVKWFMPMGYEVSTELLVPYIEFILVVEKYLNEERWGTYEEKYQKVREELARGTRKRKIVEHPQMNLLNSSSDLNKWCKGSPLNI
jgi:hypothetical protein